MVLIKLSMSYSLRYPASFLLKADPYFSFWQCAKSYTALILGDIGSALLANYRAGVW